MKTYLSTWFASQGAQDWRKVTLAHSRANYKLDIIAICFLSFFKFLHNSDVFLPVKTFIYVADSCF